MCIEYLNVVLTESVLASTWKLQCKHASWVPDSWLDCPLRSQISLPSSALRCMTRESTVGNQGSLGIAAHSVKFDVLQWWESMAQQLYTLLQAARSSFRIPLPLWNAPSLSGRCCGQTHRTAWRRVLPRRMFHSPSLEWCQHCRQLGYCVMLPFAVDTPLWAWCAVSRDWCGRGSASGPCGGPGLLFTAIAPTHFTSFFHPHPSPPSPPPFPPLLPRGWDRVWMPPQERGRVLGYE